MIFAHRSEERSQGTRRCRRGGAYTSVSISIYQSINLSSYISYICNDMSYLLPLLSHIALKNAPKELDVAEEAVRALSISINPSI